MDARGTIWTIGHSNLGIDAFVGLLQAARIEAVADVRSSPWSRHNPQFNREPLKNSLKAAGMAYAWLGDQLGGRPGEPRYYCEGVADYRLMRQAPSFDVGLDRVTNGANTYRVALMCAEKHPLNCHRCLLVGRALYETGHPVVHLLHDGSTTTQADVEEELLVLAGTDGADLFAPREERVDAAYWAQNRKNAFEDPRKAEG
jgi:uncharacterized protein (DUF488 family)